MQLDRPPRVMVVMIVRDEAGRVSRALDSVRGYVDSWLIVDTGSTDTTIADIEAATVGWPGLLVRRPWESFGANRTELLELARQGGRAEWLLTIDADHVVEDAAAIRAVSGDAAERGMDEVMIPFATSPRVWVSRLLRAERPWRYVGATREYLTCDVPVQRLKVDRPQIRDLADGSNRANKFHRDLGLLRAELTDDPGNARSWFYLGETYRGLEQHELAVIAYANCAVSTRSGEERYLALTMSGEMLFALGRTEDGLARVMAANAERPQRREALLMACQVLNRLGRHREVVRLLRGDVITTAPSEDITAILPDAYGPAMARELAKAHSGLGRRPKGSRYMG
jgi:tetratricopeptide (TPR) repeat protein